MLQILLAALAAAMWWIQQGNQPLSTYWGLVALYWIVNFVKASHSP